MRYILKRIITILYAFINYFEKNSNFYYPVSCLLVCLSAFGQDYVNPSYRQGFAAEVEAGYICKGAYTNFSLGYNGYICKGAYTNFSLGYNIIYERACTGDDLCTIGLIYRF